MEAAPLGVRIVLFLVLFGGGLAALWMAVAAASGRITRNGSVGLRIASTRQSEVAWRAAHVRIKGLTIGVGVVSLAAGVVALLPVSEGALGALVLVASAIMLALSGVSIAAGRAAALRAARSEAEDAARE